MFSVAYQTVMYSNSHKLAELSELSLKYTWYVLLLFFEAANGEPAVILEGDPRI